jgi:protein MpaA
MLGTIHGDEDAGAALLEMLTGHLRSHPGLLEGNRVVLFPISNPDGKAKRRRRNANGVDLNRNFDSNNFEGSRRHGSDPLSEPEARAIRDLIVAYPPQQVLSIHQPLGIIDYDGPADDLAERISAASGLPVSKLGSRPGSLGSYVGVDLQIPIVTVELPAHSERLSDHQLWQRYGALVLCSLDGP